MKKLLYVKLFSLLILFNDCHNEICPQETENIRILNDLINRNEAIPGYSIQIDSVNNDKKR